MSKEETTATGDEPEARRTLGDMDAAEFSTTLAESIGGVVKGALEEAGVGRVDRSRVVVRPDAEHPIGATSDIRVSAEMAARAVPRWEHQYRGLPAWEREIRTPESDYMIQRHLQGIVEKDSAKIREVIEWDPSLTPDQKRAALAEGAAATGGNLVPSPMSNLIIEKKSKVEAIGPRSRVFTSANQTIDVPVESVVMVAAGVAEAGTIAENDPTFGQVTLTKKKAAAATRSSRELLADTPFNLVSALSNQAARALALYNDSQDANDGDGTGTNQTDALDNNSSITKVSAAVATLAYTEVTAIFYALASQYRASAVWICDNAVIQVLANLLDTNGRPMFVGANEAATPLTGGQGAPGVGSILGRPVLESPGMPVLGADPAGVLLFGDLDFYGVLQDGAIRVEASDQAAFLADQVVWKFVQRRDGAVLQAEAFKKSTGITG